MDYTKPLPECAWLAFMLVLAHAMSSQEKNLCCGGSMRTLNISQDNELINQEGRHLVVPDEELHEAIRTVG